MSQRGFTGIDVDLLAQVLPGPIASGDGLVFNGRAVPVRGGIVRFCEDDSYNGSVALQWSRFKTNQIDAINGTRLSLRRFVETGWPEADLAGKLVLEAGCGAGRFTRVLAETGARLVTFDYSGAIDICRENNGRFSNVVFLQCDIFDMPFRPGAFDYVFCHGVLQHMPDPKAAFMALARHVAPGGRISIDIYRKDGLIRPWKSKYIWRPLTRRMSPERPAGYWDAGGGAMSAAVPDRRARSAFFDRLAATWSRTHYGPQGDMVERIARFAGALDALVPAGAAILDYGCGTGDIAAALAARGYRVEARDKSAKMIAQARALHAGSTARFVEAEDNPAEIAAGEGSFDAVVCSSVLEYVRDVPESLRALAAALKPGGWLVATVPNMPHPQRRREAVQRAVSLFHAAQTHPVWQDCQDHPLALLVGQRRSPPSPLVGKGE